MSNVEPSHTFVVRLEENLNCSKFSQKTSQIILLTGASVETVHCVCDAGVRDGSLLDICFDCSQVSAGERAARALRTHSPALSPHTNGRPADCLFFK